MSSQRGFTMVSAIFILVVLAALGAAVVTVSTSQQIGSALDVQGARAYQAARAGAEWGMAQVWASNPSCRMGTESYCGGSTTAAKCPASATAPASASFTPPAPTLADFVVTVQCTPFTDAGGGPTTFKIEAWACNAPASGSCHPGNVSNSNYVERYVVVTF